jgi:hypothetical protein
MTPFSQHVTHPGPPALVKKDLSAAHGLRNALANHDRAEKLLAATKPI